MSNPLKLCIIGCLLLFVGQAYGAVPNPLKSILGTHTEVGQLHQGDQKTPLKSVVSCQPLADGTAVLCTGYTGTFFAWLDVFEWNPKTGWITKTSHSTTAGERVAKMSGPWDAKTRTWTLTGQSHHLKNPPTELRSTRQFMASGQRRFRLYATIKGTEHLIIETQTTTE